jgi:hypothetical protein
MRDISASWDMTRTAPPRVGSAIVGTAILTTGDIVTGTMTVTAAASGAITGEQTITGAVE